MKLTEEQRDLIHLHQRLQLAVLEAIEWEGDMGATSSWYTFDAAWAQSHGRGYDERSEQA